MKNSSTSRSEPTSNAGVWRRLAAFVYDLLLVVATWMLTTLILVVLRGGQAISPGAPGYQLLLLGVAAAFFVSCWIRGGQTLGMRAWRIRLERRSGEPVDLRTGMLRFAAGLLSVISCGAGLLWLWIDREALTWHDRLAGTRVVVLPAKSG